MPILATRSYNFDQENFNFHQTAVIRTRCLRSKNNNNWNIKQTWQLKCDRGKNWSRLAEKIETTFFSNENVLENAQSQSGAINWNGFMKNVCAALNCSHQMEISLWYFFSYKHQTILLIHLTAIATETNRKWGKENIELIFFWRSNQTEKREK